MPLFEFLNLKPQAFGLDLSDLSFKIVQLSRRGDFFHLDCAATFPVPPKIIEAGEVKDEKTLTGVLREGISKIKNLRTKHVVCSLPEEQAFLQLIRMPRMEADELQKAIVFEAENYIPIPVKEVYLDFEIIPHLEENPDHIDVLLAAVPKRVVESYLTCFRGAGLYPIALEVESFAVARALVKRKEVQGTILLLDLGATRTGLSIFSGSSLKFTVSIPVSAGNLSEAIAKSLKIEFSKAEDVKRMHGLTERRRGGGKEVFDALIPILVDLVGQIKKYLEYYKTHSSHEHLSPNGEGVERVYLCGGGANLKGLPSFLASELKLPVELGNPWINILPEPLKEVPEISHEESLAYTTALGLALRGAG